MIDTQTFEEKGPAKCLLFADIEFVIEVVVSRVIVIIDYGLFGIGRGCKGDKKDN